MRRLASDLKQRISSRQALVLFILLLPALVAPAAFHPDANPASVVDFEIVIFPFRPTADDYISIELSGTWPHTCYPEYDDHWVDGNEIYIFGETVYHSSLNVSCFSEPTPWSFTVNIGQLEEGRYTVHAYIYDSVYDIEYEKSKTFEVRPAVGDIWGIVFEDTDRDGEFAANEPRLYGVEVALREDPEGANLETWSTGYNGKYEFYDLEPGTYYVVVIQDPPGYTPVTPTTLSGEAVAGERTWIGDIGYISAEEATPTNTPTPTPTATPTFTPTPSVTPSPTVTLTPTATGVPSSSKPYIVYFRADGFSQKWGKWYIVRATIQNPADITQTVRLNFAESGCLVDYDEPESVCLQDTVTLELAPNSTETREWHLRHQWDWTKGLNSAELPDWIVDRVWGAIKQAVKLPLALDILDDVEKVLEEQGLTKPINIYRYTVSCPQEDCQEPREVEARVQVKVPEDKVVNGAASYLYKYLGDTATSWAIVESAKLNPIGAAGLLAIEDAALLISNDAYLAAFDPDPEYCQVEEIEPVSFSEFDNLPESPGKRAAFKLVELLSAKRALYTSLGRHQGALEAGDAECAERQLLAAWAYVQESKTRLPELDAALSDVRNQLKDHGPVTQDDIETVKNYVRENGLPPDEVDFLRRYGFTDEQIRVESRTLLNLVDTVLPNYEHFLDGSAIFKPALDGVEQYLEEELGSKIRKVYLPLVTQDSGSDRHPSPATPKPS